jgi:opacity protein-like surface antigen
MKTALATVLALCLSVPVAAQSRAPAPAADDEPSFALRPFFVLTGEKVAAKQTFDATFGQSFEPFFGGGLELVLSKMSGFYVDGAFSRFKKTGQRAFRANGQNFPLGIPLTATLTPLEVSVGYRFRMSPRVFPYVGVGVGSYGYKESSAFSDAGENVDTRHSGYLAVGGAELRVHRWVGIAGDVQYTHVPGILGNGGISKDAGENDLGGIAVRLRVTLGR